MYKYYKLNFSHMTYVENTYSWQHNRNTKAVKSLIFSDEIDIYTC